MHASKTSVINETVLLKASPFFGQNIYFPTYSDYDPIRQPIISVSDSFFKGSAISVNSGTSS